MKIWLYALISVIAVSLISLIGVVTLSIKREKLHKILILFVSFAIGALFGDAFIHLIPEAFTQIGSNLKTALLILAGILIFFVMEKIIRLRECHDKNCHGHLKPYVIIILVGDGFHNFIDGMVIAASYAVSIEIGIATTIAVILHEIPSEIGDFSALLHGGLSTKKALLFNFLSALTAIAGALVSLLLGQFTTGYAVLLLPITAGGFIYLAGSDLLPELYSDKGILKSILQLVCIILGISIMASLIFFG